MKKILTILSLISFNLSIAQTKEYKRIDLKPDKNKITSDSLDIFETYQLNSLMFIFGWTQKKGVTPQISKMIIKNSSGNIIFSKMGQVDSYIFRPTFFETNNSTDPIIIFIESGSEYSWGNTVFRIKNNSVEELGEIDVSNYDTLDNNSGNIAPLTLIKSEGDTILFKFSSNKILYNPGGQKEKIYDGLSLWYVYSKGQLEMKIK